MDNYLSAKTLKEQASIVTLLNALGYQPVKKSGKEHMYRSMLRDGDNTPSFTVDDRIGAWFDHGSGKGGNIIDFGLAYWRDLDFKGVVEKIQQVCNTPLPVKEYRPRMPVKVRNYKVDQVKPIGTHPAITSYLKGRGVLEVAGGRLSELYYHVLNDQGEKKCFFAAGWKNEAGSWEVRNKFFKGCLGSKAITFVPGDTRHAAIFEGYINYLSWLTENRAAKESVIILNTLSLLREGIVKATQFSKLDVYFDRDIAGFQAAREFIKALPYADDRSSAFQGFNDYNDKIVAVSALVLKADRGHHPIKR
ncbi:CHC2 zinc finger domain-containing protein [Mucilaginibacter sp. HD30]